MVRIRSSNDIILNLLDFYRMGSGTLEPRKGENMCHENILEAFIEPEEPQEFENGWDINVGSFLRMALEPGSVWTPKDSGYTLIIRELDPKELSVACDVEGHDLDMHVSIKGLLAGYNPPSLHFEFAGPIEFGATCEKCNRHFEYQKKSAGFACWACENGY